MANSSTDKLVTGLDKGVRALYAGKWDRAVELLEPLAQQDDRPGLAARAKQYISAAQQRKEEAAGAKADDPFLQAVYHKNRGELEEAFELCKRRQKDERFVYLAASIRALEGDVDEAVRLLGNAVEMNEENRVHAFHDSDFDTLREDPENHHLFGLE